MSVLENYWIAAVIFAIALHWLGNKTHALFFAIFALPSTVGHEVLHFAMGFLFGARPSSITLTPKRQIDGGYQLGGVTFRNLNYWNAAPVALAPLLAMPIAWKLVHWRIVEVATKGLHLSEGIWCYLAACLIVGCIPSSTDIRIAFKSWPIALLGLICWLWWIGAYGKFQLF